MSGTRELLLSVLHDNNVSLQELLFRCHKKHRYSVTIGELEKLQNGEACNSLTLFVVESWFNNIRLDKFLLSIKEFSSFLVVARFRNDKLDYLLRDGNLNLCMLQDKTRLGPRLVLITTILSQKIQYTLNKLLDVDYKPHPCAMMIWQMVYFDRNIHPSRKVTIEDRFPVDVQRTKIPSYISFMNRIKSVANKYLTSNRLETQVTSFQYTKLVASFEYRELLVRLQTRLPSRIYFIDVDNYNMEKLIDISIISPETFFVFFDTGYSNWIRELEKFDHYYFRCEKGDQSADVELCFTTACLDLDLPENINFYIVSDDKALYPGEISSKRDIISVQREFVHNMVF